MQFKLEFSIVLALAIVSIPGYAQTVNKRNYRQYATCTETVINGKVFSSFGEGNCPPGSRRTSNSLDPNERTMAQTQSAVNAIGGMQRAVLSWGNARVQKKREETLKILNSFVMLAPLFEISPEQTKYSITTRLFPEAGSLATAETGKALIKQQSGFYSDCFISADDREKTYMGWVHVVKAGLPACKLSSKDNGFFPSYTNYSRNKDRTTDPFIYEQFLELDKDLYSICIKDIGIKFGCSKDIPETGIQTFIGFVGTRGSERSLVTYQGVKDGFLIFAYNEPDTVSGAAPQEITVNPSESRNVTIGTIKFEIVEWSETAIAVKMQ